MKNKKEWYTAVRDVGLVIAGTVILALGSAVFLIPFDLVTGGMTGIAIAVTKMAGLSWLTVDLVVTDVITPYMDGITLAKKLRAEFPAIQIVFISGHADVQFLREALKTDAFDYILKSVDLDELSATITRVVKLLDKRSAETARVTTMEDQLQFLMPLNRERALQTLLTDDPDMVTLSYLGLNLDLNTRYVCMVVRLVRKWKVVKNFQKSQSA